VLFLFCVCDRASLQLLKRGPGSGSDNPGGQAGIVMNDKTVAALAPLTLRLNPEGGFVGRFDLR
jgi:hypothetical protein